MRCCDWFETRKCKFSAGFRGNFQYMDEFRLKDKILNQFLKFVIVTTDLKSVISFTFTYI